MGAGPLLNKILGPKNSAIGCSRSGSAYHTSSDPSGEFMFPTLTHLDCANVEVLVPPTNTVSFGYALKPKPKPKKGLTTLAGENDPKQQ